MAERTPSPEAARRKPRTSSTSEPSDGAVPAADALEPLIVALGACPGSTDTLRTLLGAIPDKPNLSFVVVQQSETGAQSDLAGALAAVSVLPVHELHASTPAEPNRIYVAPPNVPVALRRGTLHPLKLVGARGKRTLFDRFFKALARDARERAVGIVLCGGGADGVAGLKDIKEHGGLTIVEEAHEAVSTSLGAAPFATAHIDMILPPERMAEKLVSYAQRAYLRGSPRREETVAAPGFLGQRDEELLPITELLRHETTHDFRRYRKNTLWRRIHRRMGLNQVDDISDYLLLLQGNRVEVQALRRDLLICVTRFFRDAEAWSVLESRVLRPLVGDPDGGRNPIRVWVPGCATGEEAYTLAMLLHEQLAAAGSIRRVQIFATDIAEDALDVARAGAYPIGIESDVSPERLRRFFISEDGTYRVTKRLRESVVFAEQNVLAQPPFTRLDLIVCRNLLIYLEPDAQRRVMDVFQYALQEDSHLFLGNSETVGASKPLFAPVSKKWRIFRRTAIRAGVPVEQIGDSNVRVPLLRAPQVPPHVRAGGRARDIPARVHRQLLRELDRGIAVVDAHNRLLYLHGSADLYLQLSVGELPGDYPDVLALARDGLRTKLRGAIRKVRETQQRSTVEARVLRDARYRRCSITVRPLEGGVQGEGLLFVSFEPVVDTSAAYGGDSVVESFDAESSIVRELQQELATTREQLSSTIEDLEAANDALRVSNEEAISMNEELQSGNEELETSKEELQSLNEELTTLNHQLETKVAELQSTTNDLDNLLTSSHVPTIFLDPEWRIRRFTPSCTALFKLIETDVGRPLSDIAAELVDPHLGEDACAVLADLKPRERQVRASRGDRFYQRRVLPYRSADDRIEGVVVTFADVTDLQRTTLLLRRRERQQKALANLGQCGLVERDPQALMDVAVQTVKQTFEADFVKLLEALPDGSGLLLRAGVGWREGVVGRAVIEHESDSQAAYTFAANQPVVVRNLREDPRFNAPGLLLEHGVVSGISTVVRGRTAPIGVLAAYTRHEARFTRDDVDFVEAVAHILSGAIQRGRNEQAVREAEERLRLATSANDLGTWDYDPRAEVIVASARAKELFGLPRDAVVSHETFLARVDPRDRRRLVVTIGRCLDPKGTHHCDIEYRALPGPDGAERWVRDTRRTFFENERPVRMIGTLEDVTTRKEAERANEDRLHLADRLQRIAEATPGTIFTFRMASGRKASFPYAAPHVRDTWGLEPEAIAHDATPLFARIHPEDGKKLAAVTAESARTMSMWHAQFRYDHPHKGDVWIELFASPVREPHGSILWHGIAHDVTELKYREMELLEARSTAEAANRAKGEFLANMSHEIRTPMSAILGYTEILGSQLKDPDNLQNLDTIRNNGLYLLEIIDDILDLSRIEAGKLEIDRQRVRPETLVWEVQSLLKLRAAEKGLPLEVEFAGQLPETIETDSTRVRQILINLVENAIKFTDEGRVRIVVGLDDKRSLLRFDVVDTGIGIPEETLSRLFRPFTQADSSVTRRFGGSGLGLSICRALGKMLGGDVSVTTRTGEGSTFTLTVATGDLRDVPLFDPRQRARAAVAWREDLRTLDCNVLVVDDRRDMRYLAQHMLEEAGARVALGVDGSDALDQVAMAEDRGEPFDAILLDMQMPVLDGYAAARQLRGRGFLRPIIALTANAMKQDEKKCLASGCDDYLSKPLSRATLINTIGYYTQELSNDELAARRRSYGAYDAVSGGVEEVQPRSERPLDGGRKSDPDETNFMGEATSVSEVITQSGATAPRIGAPREVGARLPQAEKILLVDDNLDSCALLRMLLESAGCEVTVAEDAAAALAAADGPPPDVAVIDLGLPGMSGDELVVELRARQSLAACRFICLSGRHPSEIDWRAAGFDHFLQKPARFDELRRLLGR